MEGSWSLKISQNRAKHNTSRAKRHIYRTDMAISSSSPSASPFWAARVHADRRPFLAARARILSAWRRWFEAEDFTEVETAILQVSPGNEAHISAFATDFIGPDGSASRLYLHSSPEFACKKLLAAGEERIFTLGRVFRNKERGPLHAPEFTMLEWYRADSSYHVLIDDCAALATQSAAVTGSSLFEWRGRSCDPFASPEILPICESFQRFAGVDLHATLSADGGDRDHLASLCGHLDLRIAQDDSWSDIFSKVISAIVEPHLGIGRMTVLDLYPLCEAALARPSEADPLCAERFELYACGVELANAFGELTDPVEQRRRFETEMQERMRIYGEAYPLDEDFLAALAVMPPASGIALGADRMIMLATGARSIDQVMWTPLPPDIGG